VNTLAANWQQNMKDGVLRLPKCDSCDHWNWYPLPVCKGCGKSEFTWTEIPASGTLFSWTRVHRNFTGLDMGSMPYVVGLVSLDGAPGVRVPARYLGEDVETLTLNRSVCLSFEVFGDITSLCFRL
jgi:uncharacterized OB-fold protein